MIPIFRKTRKKMADDNPPDGRAGKPMKYMRYAIGEIVLVVVEIDEAFKQTLKDSERYGCVDFDVSNMKPQLLKDFYIIEKVKHSKFRFLHRQTIDKKNDVVIYSSIATHEEEPFTHIEETILKTEMPTIEK